jgi:hypothetical protein
VKGTSLKLDYFKITWPRAHWLAGTFTLILFPLAGAYMRYIAVVPELDDAPRLVFRSRFLLLLLIAVANLALCQTHPKLFVQRVASVIILAAPLPLITAFLIDPSRGVRGSPWTTWTMRALFLAGGLLAFTHRPWR